MQADFKVGHENNLEVELSRSGSYKQGEACSVLLKYRAVNASLLPDLMKLFDSRKRGVGIKGKS